MFYEKELAFLQDTFHKCQIPSRVLHLEELTDPSLSAEWRQALTPAGRLTEGLHILTDQLGCGRMVMPLPHSQPEQVLLIGPYLTRRFSSEDILEEAELHGFTVQEAKAWEERHAGLPLLLEGSHLYAVLDVFGERLWGEQFRVIERARPLTPALQPLPAGSAEADKVLQQMEAVELRYSYENELIRMVEQGQTLKADRWLANLSTMPFEKRSADPVRNLKNYSIIMNTLLRKAAEKGGVHPFHVDAISSDFARQIEAVTSVQAIQELMSTMFRGYCRLVKNHSMKPYSPPVQRVLTCINADLTANLQLATLAKAQKLSGGYLSTLFRRETGMTLTAYVHQKRMERAMQLLADTHLQIQTVAQYCGIEDVQYFSKLFKKHTGQAPKEFRHAAHQKP